ncbi:MAG: hypothetical protein ACOC06_07565 [Halorubrum sp.]
MLAVTSEVGNRYEWHQHVNVVRGVGTDDAEIAALYDDEAVVGIAAAARGYDALGGMIDAFDLELEPGAEFHGWDPR